MTETPAPTIWPALTYADAPAAVHFLVEAFGFVETLVVPGEGGREIAHAELRWPEGGGVMLGSTCDDSEFGRLKPGTTSIYVVTDTPDKVFERATMAGAEVVRGLKTAKKSGRHLSDSAIRKEDPALYGAAVRLFGSFTTARAAAGIKPPRGK